MIVAPQKREADSIFYELTRSICPTCRAVIDAQILLRDGKVYMRKRCVDHGWFEGLIYSDAMLYANSLRYNKPGTIPLAFSTEVKAGCPYDCGLCPEHKQHACLGIIEVNTGCNLACPVCFADAGEGYNLTVDDVERMLDQFVECEGEGEVIQFSGGEPTIHPEILTMLRAAKRRPIKYVMLNTNGLRIARDERFVAQLAEVGPTIYLQFDGLLAETLIRLRGRDLVDEKRRALDRLGQAGLKAILVAAIERGVNEHEVGPLVRFALGHPAVRGITFQPVTHVARHLPFNPMERITIPDVIRAIEKQTDGLFVQQDFVPVPCCFPTCSSVTYAYVDGGRVTPLPRLLDVQAHLDYITNRTVPELSTRVRKALEGLWSASAIPGTERAADQFSCASCGLDLGPQATDLADRIFMITIKDFMDAYTFNVKSLMKCCVEVLVPDGRMIPFCAYNTVVYREQVRAQLSARGRR
ncbi:MAG: radical SAM protein [candidate division NC10 bacterium]|nr:radical SAM protein [candidate division NC10 bacterium]